MKTTIVNPKTVDRKWYIVDAKDKTLGRLSTVIADTLRGKNKTNYSPSHDTGDHVIVLNADKIKLTGKKLDQKKYYSHSQYAGGLKEINAKDLLVKKPTRVLEHSISGMLPKNKLRDVFMSKLHLYAGETHPHEAQQPINLDV